MRSIKLVLLLLLFAGFAAGCELDDKGPSLNDDGLPIVASEDVENLDDGTPAIVFEASTTFDPEDDVDLVDQSTVVGLHGIFWEWSRYSVPAIADGSGETGPVIPHTVYYAQIQQLPPVTGWWANGSVFTLDNPNKAGLQNGYWILIDQHGGYTTDENGNSVWVSVNGDAPLKSGTQYMFALRYDPDTNFYQITYQPNGDEQIDETDEGTELTDRYETASETTYPDEVSQYFSEGDEPIVDPPAEPEGKPVE